MLTAQDWPIWRELRLTALTEAPQAFGSRLADWTGDNDVEERWRGRLSIAGSHNVVALVRDRAAGMASGVPTSEDGVVELISMWVAPHARGAGVGDALVSEVSRWARSVDALVLRLSVAEDNAPAVHLYERHGFRFTSEVNDPMADRVRRERVMEQVMSP